MTSIDAATLKRWLRDGAELALVDVREAGEFGESHLFPAVPIAYSRFEPELERLVPRRSVPVVLCDADGGALVRRAAQRAAALGYRAVHVLAGGNAGWTQAGYGLYQGVHVPSKTFGELVEHAYRTPRITAPELALRMQRGDELVIVDGRPWPEYRRMNIPGSICCPNGELALRIGRIAPDPSTCVVVNCAGRTRSIIGAQTLRLLGVPNPVLALENGTQGWFLAGFELERGATRRYPAAPSGAELERLRERVRQLMRRHAIAEVEAATADAWLAATDRTTLLLDVRTEEEFAAAHLPGSEHAPGGQLVQATDQWIAVRGARIVLVDADGVRAPLTALWLAQQGHEVHVLREGVAARLAWRPPRGQAASLLPEVAALAPERAAGTRLVDLRSSAAYRQAHPEGAIWSIRPRVVADAAGATRVALLADDDWTARCAAADLVEAGAAEVTRLAGGLDAWRQAGLPIVSTPGRPADAERIDHLFFTHDRHDGNRAAALRYLAWETGLIGQLDADERAGFRIPQAHSA